MKKRDLALALILTLEILGCAARAPQKPAGLPAEAFWVGDHKGGTFVVIGPKDREGWRVKLFDDHSGAAKAEGLFTLRGLARAEIVPEEVVSYDGFALHLSDGALLAPKPQP